MSDQALRDAIAQAIYESWDGTVGPWPALAERSADAVLVLVEQQLASERADAAPDWYAGGDEQP